MARWLLTNVLGAVVAVVLQLLLSNVIAIGYAHPNIILVYVVVAAVLNPDRPRLVTAFVLGLVFDLSGSGPVGAMALLCVVVSYALAKLMGYLNNDTIFMPLALIVAAMFIVDILYGVLFGVLAHGVNLLDMVVYRSLPCGLYDSVLGVIAFPLAARIVAGSRDAGL